MLTNINMGGLYLKISEATCNLESSLEMDDVWESAALIRTSSQVRYQDILEEAVYVNLFG